MPYSYQLSLYKTTHSAVMLSREANPVPPRQLSHRATEAYDNDRIEALVSGDTDRGIDLSVICREYFLI